MSEQLDTKTGWLAREQLENIRANVPLVYVDAVPVRVDELGRVTHVGMLLRQAADGTLSRMVVSGRVLFGERMRDALLRHLEKDLGPVALPRIPPRSRRSRWSSTSPTPTSAASTIRATTRSAWPSSCPSPATASRRRRRSTSRWFTPDRGRQRAGPPGDDRRPRPPHPPGAGPRRPAAVAQCPAS